MGPPSIPCLDENGVAQYLAQETRDEEREAVRAHLDSCDQCRELVAGLVRTMVSAEPDEQIASRTLPRGTNLARYLVLDPIGGGGMGVVYTAYDPELDRKVALKLLRPDLGTSATDAGRAQVLAEAQAMARLSHPNIITVFDVGTWEGEVFFAMEFVRGQTLRAAQAAGDQRPQRLLDLYLAAGMGLSAAHKAGIIHRDFKPENVLVGADGKVCVTDFGLARAAHDVDTKLAGTPAYMAPEQWRGAPADVRTDQYSYCVALHEAIYGSRPLRAKSSPAQETLSTRVPARVPPGLGRVIARGLEVDPAARWPSVEALVAALREARRPFRTGTLLAVAALVLLTVALWTRHWVETLRVERELTAAAQRLPELLRAQHDLIELEANVGLVQKGVLDAFGQASNMDAALGLAENPSNEKQFAEAHAVMRSADLPGLKDRDALLLVNAWGRVVLNLADVQAYGAASPALPMLVSSMDEVSTDELWSAATLNQIDIPLVKPVRADDLLLVSARPVVRGASVVGAILSGSWVGRELLDELSHTAGAQIALHAPDGGWAGVHWTSVPPLGRLIRMRFDGRDYVVYGVKLGAPGSRTPAGEGFAYRELALNADSGFAAAWLRWALAAASLLALAWLAWLRWWYG